MCDVRVQGAVIDRSDEILTPDALAFVADLHRRFGRAATSCSPRRAERRAAIAATGRAGLPGRDRGDPCARTGASPPAPPDLTDRRVEITGPTERKMAINALNSGAKVWLADLEDANTPHWANVVDGQQNLYDAIRRTITLETDEKTYELSGGPYPTIVVRPRGWHLDERHLPVDGEPAVGALVDFGLLLLPQRPGADRPRQRAVLLPAEDGEPPRGAAVERRLHLRPGRARHPARAPSGPPC